MSENRTKDLKTWPEFFEAIVDGRKPFDLRRDDRAYEVGDTLRLREWRFLGGYSGREHVCRVSYVLRDAPEFGLQSGYAILGTKPLPYDEETVRAALDIAAQAVATVDEWLGMATTRQAADDAVWRLRRALQRAGVRVPGQAAYDYRGSILKALERAGMGIGEDGKVRERLQTDKPWQHASGPILRTPSAPSPSIPEDSGGQ